MVFWRILFLVLLFFPLGAEEYVKHTIKQYNLRFSFPYTWRWNNLNPDNHEGQVFELYSPNKKFLFQIWAENSRNLNTVKAFHKHQKKWNLSLETTPDFAPVELPNLQHLGVFMAQVRTVQEGKPFMGYFFTGTDGIWLYLFRLEVEAGEFLASKEIFDKILGTLDMNYDWNHICCALCLKEIRYSARRTTICSDFISENPCYTYFKNSKMDYEKCK